MGWRLRHILNEQGVAAGGQDEERRHQGRRHMRNQSQSKNTPCRYQVLCKMCSVQVYWHKRHGMTL